MDWPVLVPELAQAGVGLEGIYVSREFSPLRWIWLKSQWAGVSFFLSEDPRRREEKGARRGGALPKLSLLSGYSTYFSPVRCLGRRRLILHMEYGRRQEQKCHGSRSPLLVLPFKVMVCVGGSSPQYVFR